VEDVLAVDEDDADSRDRRRDRKRRAARDDDDSLYRYHPRNRGDGRCPECGSRRRPFVTTRYGTVSWILIGFGVIVWPLLIFGLLMRERVTRCPDCHAVVDILSRADMG
jgi:DNA-directed RNA polymerase subunit RPC12/RpoP